MENLYEDYVGSFITKKICRIKLWDLSLFNSLFVPIIGTIESFTGYLIHVYLQKLFTKVYNMFFNLFYDR